MGDGILTAAATNTATASGTLWSRVVLADPLYTGPGSLIDSSTFIGTAPKAGDIVYYDSSNGFTILPSGEIFASVNSGSWAFQYYDGTAIVDGVAVILASALVGPARDTAAGSGALTAKTQFVGNAADAAATIGSLSTSIKLATSAVDASLATGRLAGISGPQNEITYLRDTTFTRGGTKIFQSADLAQRINQARQFPKALMYLAVAHSAHAGVAPAWIDNWVSETDSGAPLYTGATALALTAGVGGPDYFAGATSQDGSNTAAFNADLVIFGPDYDVIDLVAFGNFSAANATQSAGLRATFPEHANSDLVGMQLVSSDLTACKVNLTVPKDQDASQVVAGFYTSSGVYTQAFTAELAGAITGDSTGTFTLANFANSPWGGSAGVTGSMQSNAAQQMWQPWAGEAVAVPAAGAGCWTAIRYRKCTDATSDSKIYTIDVISSFYGGGTAVRTLNFQVFGTQRALGIPICATRCTSTNFAAQAVYVVDVAASAFDWVAAAKEQGDQFITTGTAQKALTTTSQHAIGCYSIVQDPTLDHVRKSPATVGTQIQGRVKNGLDILIRSSAALGAYNCYSGATGGITGTSARVDLVSPDGSIVVPQYLKNWGVNVINYRNRNCTSAKYTEVIRLTVTQGSLPNLYGCSFKIYSSANVLLVTLPLIGAVKLADQIATP